MGVEKGGTGVEGWSIPNLIKTRRGLNFWLTPCLRSQNEFALPQVRTESCGKGTLRYLGPLIWNIIPSEIKNLSSLNEFKKQIRQWRPLACPCRLCRNYIPHVGFI